MADDKDSVSDDVRAAFESLETDTAPAAVPAEVEADPAADTGGTRARNPDGTFAPKEPDDEPKEPKRETLRLKEKPQEAAPPTTAVAPQSPPSQATPAAPGTEKIAPPASWSGMEKVKWDRLPAPIQEGIARREQEREAATADLLPLKELIDVNREYLIRGAGSVAEGFRQTMAFVKMYDDNPALLIQSIAQRAGIDLRALVGGQQNAPTQQQPSDPQSLVAQLVQQQMQPIVAQLQQQQAAREQQETQQLQTTIDQFGADPKHPFFNDVRYDMGVLIDVAIKNQRPITLEKAYEQATWANDAIRAHLIEEQRGAADAAKAAEVQKAQQARRAIVNGSPLPGAIGLNGKTDPKATALDDVRSAYDELSGA